jgi:hypothetical protein
MVAGMTDPDASSTLYTSYFTTLEEVLDNVNAADTLGLGFKLESYMVADADDPSTAHPEYAFTLLGEMPLKVEADEPAPAPSFA